MAKRETATEVREREGMSAAELIARTVVSAFEPDSTLVYFGSKLTEAIKPLIRKQRADAVRRFGKDFGDLEVKTRANLYADALERGGA